MGLTSDDLMKLRPVTFHYKAEYDDGSHLLQYGLIAEEVAKILPGLVQFDATGQPLSVRYHWLPTMLLNEVQKQNAKIEEQAAEIASQQERMEETIAAQAVQLAQQGVRLDTQQTTIASQAARLEKLEAEIVALNALVLNPH